MLSTKQQLAFLTQYTHRADLIRDLQFGIHLSGDVTISPDIQQRIDDLERFDELLYKIVNKL